MAFRFVHTGDLHLDSPFVGLTSRERKVARDAYEHARATGRAAVLVNDSGRGVLTLEVTGITPGIPLVAITDLVAVPRLEADGSPGIGKR